MEKWKDIKGYEGLYQVSDLGRIKSLIRKNERILKPYSNPETKYLSVNLHKNKRSKTYTIHHLVAEAFIPNPKNLPQVGHKDETRINNCATNLYWTTNKENSNTPERKKRLRDANIGKSTSQKTREKLSKTIANLKGRKFLCEGYEFNSLAELARYLNIPYTTMSHYANGDRQIPSTLPLFKELCIDRNKEEN